MDRNQQRQRPIAELDLLTDLNETAKFARRRSFLFWALLCFLIAAILFHFIRPAHAQTGAFDPRSDELSDGSCP